MLAKSKGPCKLAFNKSSSSSNVGGTISLKVNGKRFRYRECSVVVVCQNMNASDVQKLVPSISLSDCLNKTDHQIQTASTTHKSRCIQLLKNLPDLNPKAP